jgi:hypothetical protein
MKKIIIIIIACIDLITLNAWFVCQRFTDIFSYSSLNISYQIDTYINSFDGMPRWYAHLLHNKVIQVPIDFIRLYFQFWDIRFGTNWFSIIGYFGILVGFYYFVINKKKKLYHWIILFVLLLLPVVEILFSPPISFQLKGIYLWIPFILFSFYGIYQFLSQGDLKKRYIFILILIALSIWWFLLLPHNIAPYCIRQPFFLLAHGK